MSGVGGTTVVTVKLLPGYVSWLSDTGPETTVYFPLAHPSWGGWQLHIQ